MVSSTVGIPVNSPNGYDEYVYDDVHISMSGEYVHAAPWSVYAQGVENVSHGCINVSAANALTFYNFSSIGDVVEVTGSSRPALTSDGGVRDGSGPAWSQWTAAAVVQLSPSGTVTTTTVPVTAAPVTTPPTTATTVKPTTTTTAKSTTTVTTVKPKPTTSTTKPPATTTTLRH
jgi:cell division septation protein DedD